MIIHNYIIVVHLQSLYGIQKYTLILQNINF